MTDPDLGKPGHMTCFSGQMCPTTAYAMAGSMDPQGPQLPSVPTLGRSSLAVSRQDTGHERLKVLCLNPSGDDLKWYAISRHSSFWHKISQSEAHIKQVHPGQDGNVEVVAIQTFAGWFS